MTLAEALVRISNLEYMKANRESMLEELRAERALLESRVRVLRAQVDAARVVLEKRAAIDVGPSLYAAERALDAAFTRLAALLTEPPSGLAERLAAIEAFERRTTAAECPVCGVPTFPPGAARAPSACGRI